MADDGRVRRMSVRVREVVAQAVEHQVKDVRLGMVTITDARMTPDLREVTVFWTVWGDEAVRADSAAALEASKGMIRTAIGRGMRSRRRSTFSGARRAGSIFHPGRMALMISWSAACIR